MKFKRISDNEEFTFDELSRFGVKSTEVVLLVRAKVGDRISLDIFDVERSE